MIANLWLLISFSHGVVVAVAVAIVACDLVIFALLCLLCLSYSWHINHHDIQMRLAFSVSHRVRFVISILLSFSLNLVFCQYFRFDYSENKMAGMASSAPLFIIVFMSDILHRYRFSYISLFSSSRSEYVRVLCIVDSKYIKYRHHEFASSWIILEYLNRPITLPAFFPHIHCQCFLLCQFWLRWYSPHVTAFRRLISKRKKEEHLWIFIVIYAF